MHNIKIIYNFIIYTYIYFVRKIMKTYFCLQNKRNVTYIHHCKQVERFRSLNVLHLGELRRGGNFYSLLSRNFRWRKSSSSEL